MRGPVPLGILVGILAALILSGEDMPRARDIKTGSRQLTKDRKASAERSYRFRQRAKAFNEKASFCHDAIYQTKTDLDVRDEAFEIHEKRELYKRCIKSCWKRFFASEVEDRVTGEVYPQSLGKIHDFMFDFQSLELIGHDIETYSPLVNFLPDKTYDATGKRWKFNERWLYFRTLDGEPEIQEGPEGSVSDMFYNNRWQGMVIRICGNGLKKCILAPREHLKSTICGVTRTLWRMIRKPWERHVIRSAVNDGAKKFLTDIKRPFDGHDEFQRLFGTLKPDVRKETWSTTALQLNVDHNVRKGREHTVLSMGMASEHTGGHMENALGDDMVAEKNSQTPELLMKACRTTQAMNAQRVKNSNLDDVGTRWHTNDSHSMFVGKHGDGEMSGCLAHDSSFLVATVLDGDESVECPPLANGLEVTPLGYGKPIWGEYWTIEDIREKRSGMTNDWFWSGQYFNQFIGTTDRSFKREWIQPYPDKMEGRDDQGNTVTFNPRTVDPLTLARLLRLHITIGIDAASGKKDQKGKLDHSGLFVLGQLPDRSGAFWLDGFREKLSSEMLAPHIINVTTKWMLNTNAYNGIFNVGHEDEPHQQHLGPLLKAIQRERGVETLFTVRAVPHGNEAKWARVDLLATPYANGYFYWPKEMMVKRAVKKGERAASYDLRPMLEAEYLNFNRTSTMDDLIDAHAIAWSISLPTAWKEDAASNPEGKQRGRYNREEAEEEVDPVLSYYDGDGEVAF